MSDRAALSPRLSAWLAALLFGGAACGRVDGGLASTDSGAPDAIGEDPKNDVANGDDLRVQDASRNDPTGNDATGNNATGDVEATDAGTEAAPPDAAFDAEAGYMEDACAGTCPYDIGNEAVDGGWFDFETAPDTVFLTTVVPPKTVTIVSLRVSGRVAGGACDLYVYSDKDGTPDQRLAYQFGVEVLAGPSGAPPVASATLTAGETYWLGGNCFNPDGGMVELFQNNMLPEHGYVAVAQPYGTLVPATFPLGTTRGNTYSFFLQVQNVP